MSRFELVAGLFQEDEVAEVDRVEGAAEDADARSGRGAVDSDDRLAVVRLQPPEDVGMKVASLFEGVVVAPDEFERADGDSVAFFDARLAQRV